MEEREITLRTWDDFEDQIAQLFSKRLERKRATDQYISDYLFRGQPDSTWRLTSTLERFTNTLLTLEEYYRILCATKPQVETFTAAKWDQVPSLADYLKEIGDEQLLPPGRFPAYEYFAYLRHHGFPSPLLDWTRSPYVAAYFAFRDVCSNATNASI